MKSVKLNERSGMEELYGIFSGGIRFFLRRHLGAKDLEDRVHDTFLLLVQSLRRGEMREPERLMGFIQTLVRRQLTRFAEKEGRDRRHLAAGVLGQAIIDHTGNPEEIAIRRQYDEIARRVLKAVPSVIGKS